MRRFAPECRMTDIEQRKRDHIDIVLSGAARHSASAGFDGIAFEHNALPELCFDTIDLSTRFLGKTLKLPFLASSMTGGPADSVCGTETIFARDALGLVRHSGDDGPWHDGHG